MVTPCQHSKLEIPNDPRYAVAAGRYVASMADLAGLATEDLALLEQAVTEAVSALIRYSFDPGEQARVEIACERVPEGFKVSIRDRGLPYDTRLLAREGGTEAPNGLGATIFQLRSALDEVALHNLGREGKEIVLVKHPRVRTLQDYYAACELEPYPPPGPVGGGALPLACTVRPMQADEAAEVSKAVYKAYGYSYFYDYLYYPERIAALNAEGKVHSAVAVAGGGEIVGHCALQYWEENPRIAEAGRAVVKPAYRSMGCFEKLVQYVLDYAANQGLLGVFGQAVTNHPFSQRAGHRFGFKDCALLVAHVPRSASFKGITDDLPQRVSSVFHFRYLHRPPRPSVCLPPQHREILERIYADLGCRPSLGRPAEGGPAQDSLSRLRVNVSGPTNTARLTFDRCGADALPELRTKLKELCLKQIEAIYLYLNLADPFAAALTRAFEDLGFFFAGLLPGGLVSGDALILQYLNNVPLNYDAIMVASDMGQTLLHYIRQRDPNVIRP